MKEFDACGVGFVTDLKNKASHKIVEVGLECVKNLTHRGAVGADGKTGDGAGLLIEIPQKFFASFLGEKAGYNGNYSDIACGVIFVNGEFKKEWITDALAQVGVNEKIFFREPSLNREVIGEEAAKCMPSIIHILIPHSANKEELEVKLFLASRIIEKRFANIHVASFSAYNMVYKGMLIAPNLSLFYPELNNPLLESRYAIFHQRYSTNTAPRWELAQPFDMIAHNGEINTINANRVSELIIESVMSIPGNRVDMEKITPLLNREESDSASLNRIFRLLVLSGYSPELAINLLIPPAWEGIPFISSNLRAFFQYNEMIMEPWDGPAAVVFTDGETIGAHLDRNGLRPLRYTIYEEGTLIVGSEAGMVALSSPVIKRGKLGSGDTISVKLSTGRIRNRMEILNELALQMDYEDIIKSKTFFIEQVFQKDSYEGSLNKKLIGFGYTEEELKEIIPAAANTGAEMIFSMGDDTPLPIFAKNPPNLFRYFKQKFAQVTNPPIDPIREKGLTSLTVYLGERRNILNYSDIEHANKLILRSPVITGKELNLIKELKEFVSATIDTCYEKGLPLKTAITIFSDRVVEACKDKDVKVIILSDISYSPGKRFIPSLLAVASAVNVLKEKKLLSRLSIIVESGEVRNSHHLALLLAFGASAVNPWLAFQVAGQINERGIENFRKSLEEGLRKIMSKMGISCVSSYKHGQLFDALCLDKQFVETYFSDVTAFFGGHGLEDIEKNYGFHADRAENSDDLIPGGDLKFRKDGEWHGWSPLLLKALNKFLKDKNFESFKEYTDVADNLRPIFFRHLLEIPEGNKIPLDEVEKEEEIVKRFFTGGMSLGALSPEAHEVIIEACNRLGMRCNSGEGGEDPKRYGTEKGSSIKQVASGRFGVTPDYLASAREIEIKLAQGAKPGEGGQLPGHKVSTYIAYLRYSQPGITLISPPPHHDIYSIEDLAQLINDLKQINPFAPIGIKLVSESGIGQIAAGAVKAYADFIQISSTEGGTGASPYTSIKNAGNYWEFGLSEVHLTLVENNLRDRVTLRVDGGLKSGRDIIIAALLGADEFGFGTAAMLAEGCIMARQCHKNTCPTGIATQDPELRKRFRGKVEDVVAFFLAIARDVRMHLANIGYKSLDEIRGRAYLLKVRDWAGFTFNKRDVEEFIKRYEWREVKNTVIIRNEPKGDELNRLICADVIPYLEKKQPFVKVYNIKNTDSSVPVRLNYFISKKSDGRFLPEDTIKLLFEGVAGQSFGAFNHRGLTLELIGEANDYVGKGMFGGRIVIRPKDRDGIKTYKNYLVGNTALYGATGGEIFIAGMVGERFAVRNSGAMAVIEGAGHHLSEYMTGGVVVCLGTVGLNVGAGMTGGITYIYDEPDNLVRRINQDYVVVKQLENNDINLLQIMLNKHYFYTQSMRAKEILENFDSSLLKFKKVVPLETLKIAKKN